MLTKGGTVTGVVLDPSGAPVEGADVILSAVGADSVGTSATTDAEGRFTFDAVADADHSLLVQESAAKGQWSTRRKATVAPVRPGRGEVRVSLDGRATVVLRFLNDSDRSPVVVGSVKLSAKAVGPTPAQFAWAWSGANISAVRFQPDHAGVFDVTVEVPGWSPATAPAVEVLPDRETTIDVLFRREQ